MAVDGSRERSVVGGYRTAIVDWDLTETLTRTFDLCGAARGRACVVLHDGSTPGPTVEVARLAAIRTGATTVVVAVSGPAADGPADAACGAADLVVDLRAGADRHHPPAVASGPHVLRIGALEPAHLAAFATHPGIGRRVRTALDVVSDAVTLTLTTPGPTVLELDVAEATVVATSGVLEPTESTTRWPGGTVEVRPDGDDAAGAVAVMAGDVIAGAGRHVIAPTAVVVEAGHVCEVTGGDDAALLRAHFEHAGRGVGSGDDRDGAWRLRGVRIGLNPTAPLDEDVLLAPELVAASADVRAGIVTLAFGTGTTAPVEVLLRSASVTVDDVSVVSAGTLAGGLEPDVYERLGRSSA